MNQISKQIGVANGTLYNYVQKQRATDKLSSYRAAGRLLTV